METNLIDEWGALNMNQPARATQLAIDGGATASPKDQVGDSRNGCDVDDELVRHDTVVRQTADDSRGDLKVHAV